MKTCNSMVDNSYHAVSINAVTFVLNSITVVCYYLLIFNKLFEKKCKMQKRKYLLANRIFMRLLPSE